MTIWWKSETFWIVTILKVHVFFCVCEIKKTQFWVMETHAWIDSLYVDQCSAKWSVILWDQIDLIRWHCVKLDYVSMLSTRTLWWCHFLCLDLFPSKWAVKGYFGYVKTICKYTQMLFYLKLFELSWTVV